MKLYHDLAEFYFFIENKNRNIANDVSLVKQLLPRNAKSTILDLGCGTGEHLALLAKEGFHCFGLDNSEDMIQHARKRNGINIDYITGDMRSFDYYKKFDVVICLFGSFNYQLNNRDVDSVLYNAHRALKPGGLAIFEVWNAHPLHKIEEKPLTHISTTYYKQNKIIRKRGFKLIEKSPRTIVDVFYKYTVTSQDGIYEVDDRHVMRAYYQKEIERFVKESGFRILDRFASSLKEKFHQFSNKLILVMEKEG